jgi:hypothetical protein
VFKYHKPLQNQTQLDVAGMSALSVMGPERSMTRDSRAGSRDTSCEDDEPIERLVRVWSACTVG